MVGWLASRLAVGEEPSGQFLELFQGGAEHAVVRFKAFGANGPRAKEAPSASLGRLPRKGKKAFSSRLLPKLPGKVKPSGAAG